jgi:hypothetical protein
MTPELRDDNLPRPNPAEHEEVPEYDEDLGDDEDRDGDQ